VDEKTVSIERQIGDELESKEIPEADLEDYLGWGWEVAMAPKPAPKGVLFPDSKPAKSKGGKK
jgi:hypothetical protein